MHARSLEGGTCTITFRIQEVVHDIEMATYTAQKPMEIVIAP